MRRIVLLYPFALFAIALALNLVFFRGHPLVPAIPAADSYPALVVAAVLLVINHSWLMTATEWIRVRYGMPGTPHEWQQSGKNPADVDAAGRLAFETCHNAHRNVTENSVSFVFLALVFALASPPLAAVYIWVCLFPLARCGYILSYLRGNIGVRGAFMSLSLLSLYGMASYLLVALLVAA